MKVMVTGGTGFVGSHTVAELIRNGHQVKLLVRNMDRIKPALEPLGIGEVETVLGDVTDHRTVERAAEGCDATMHCGSIYSLDPRAAERINKTNVQGAEIVLGIAQKLGHDPIVHVSSFVALIGEKNAILSPETVPHNPRGAYIVSKADSDRAARRFQDAGAPVVITYPGSVWGPYDPHLGESCQMATNMLRRFWSVIPKGAVPITDVRDLAIMHAAIMEKGRGQRRYIAPATNIKLNKAIASISSVTGRKLPTVSLPAWLLSWPMQALDWLQPVTPFRFPFNYQAAYVTGLSSRMDDSLTRSEFGIVPRPLEETFADTIRWMAQAGHLPDKLAGKLVKVL